MMNKPLHTTSLNQRSGLTLVEVVTGIVLLSTLLVAVLMAFKAHATQIQAADARLKSIKQTDQLLATWLKAESLPEVGATGTFPNDPKLSWHMVRGESQPANHLQAQTIRLEVYPVDKPEIERPLTSIELLVSSGKMQK